VYSPRPQAEQPQLILELSQFPWLESICADIKSEQKQREFIVSLLKSGMPDASHAKKLEKAPNT
jgi:hypothetical protein